MGPGWACSPARSLCHPLLGKMAYGRSREGGPRSRGKGQDAHLSQLPGSINPTAHEKDVLSQLLISVPFAARTGKPR